MGLQRVEHDWVNMHAHLHLWIDWLMDLKTWEILVPWPGIEPRPLAVKTQTPNPWTTREFHGFIYFLFYQLSTDTNWLFRGFCHYKVKVKVLVTQLCLSHCDPMDCSPPGSSVHGFLQNTGVGCHSLLHGIFPTQGSSPGLLHCRQILYHLSHQGSQSNAVINEVWDP